MFLIWPVPATAEDCADAEDVIPRLECLGDVHAAEDARLNAVWRRVLEEFPSGGDREVHREEIRAAQRAWIAFRDADCEAVAKVGIPKYWELNRLTCIVEMTRGRSGALVEAYLR